MATDAARPDGLSEDDWRLVRLWRENQVLQDPRYSSKGLLKLVVWAMLDEAVRRRLLADPDAFLAEHADLKGHLPEGVALRFLENDSDTLNVVLPPRRGATEYQPMALREVLRSRTSGLSAFKDDFDLGDFGNDADVAVGDPDFNDDPPKPIPL
jgi:hypothetical protein